MANGFIFHGDPSKETSVRIDGVRLADIGVHLLADSEEPVLPEVRTNSVTIPGRHGAYDFGSYFEPRPLTLSCGINNQATLTDVQQLTRTLSAMFLDEYGRPKEVEVVYDYEPDKFYKARLASGVQIERIARAGRFQIPLIANDPHAYASMTAYDPEEVPRYGEVGGDDYYENPISFDWIYEKHYSGINNYSNLATDFVITIEGTVTNPQVTNLNVDKTLTLPSISNGRIEIDSKRFTVIKNGGNAFGDSNGLFFDIQPGEVGFRFEGGNPNAKVTYRWLHKFM